jgi:hypothetical protein
MVDQKAQSQLKTFKFIIQKKNIIKNKLSPGSCLSAAIETPPRLAERSGAGTGYSFGLAPPG